MVKPTTNMEIVDENTPLEPKPNSKQQRSTPVVTANLLKSRDYAAVVLGNGSSRRNLDIAQLRNVGTTYSCNAAYRDFFTDYLVVMDDYMLAEIVNNKAYEDTVVYTQHTNAAQALQEQVPIYFTSTEPATLDSGSSAVKLAVQHGHKIIWMVGFDGMSSYELSSVVSNLYASSHNYPDTAFYHSNQALVEGWQRNLTKIIRDNTHVQFYHVTPRAITNTLPNYHALPMQLFQQVIQGKQP